MVHQIQEGYVKTETHYGVTIIEFYHPQSNSLPAKILNELALEIHFAGEHDESKVIILQSGGEKVFCAGASFDELLAIRNEAEGIKFFSGFANVINAMRKCPKLIIGRIHGKCVGGGVGLAAACDYAIAVETADIKLSELALGIGPFVVGPVVEKKIGASAFSQLAIDAGTWRNADWARRRGLYAEAHSTLESVDEAVRRLSSSLIHYSPQAMAELKKIFWKGTEHWEQLLHERAAISGKLILTDFAKNFIRDFKAKQAAQKNV
ncbi:MAG TPA: enoyl-CoA hydratase/isomerase family protein [Parafilimonas sp.]|nr:enoyl-CoA hydratase/isomerase family protein [Parafilimonas sp.]